MGEGTGKRHSKLKNQTDTGVRPTMGVLATLHTAEHLPRAHATPRTVNLQSARYRDWLYSGGSLALLATVRQTCTGLGQPLGPQKELSPSGGSRVGMGQRLPLRWRRAMRKVNWPRGGHHNPTPSRENRTKGDPF